jgi:uncharacterized membrane protein
VDISKILEAAVAQVPALVVLCLIVIVFIWSMEKRDKSFQDALTEQRTQWMEHLKLRDSQAAAIAMDCHSCQTKCAESVKENTRMLNRVEVRLAG